MVDDNASFRSAARAVLELHGFAVVGEAIDGFDALEQVSIFQPDLVLLDIQLPGLDGIEVAERLSRFDKPPVMVLTSSRLAADYGERLLSAPASAFITKEEVSAVSIAQLVQQR